MSAPIATAFVLIRPTTAGLGPALKRDLEAQSGTAAAAGKKTGASWARGFQSSGVTKVAGRISEGLAGAGVASAVMAAKFQSSMERLSTQAGVPQSKIKALGDGILNLAGQVGFSPGSLAASLYHVESNFASMGITSKKALSLVKIAAEGAAVGGANLTDVTNALTAAVASGIPGVSDFGKAMGTLNAIVGAGDMTMQDLADAFGTGVLASVKQFGVTIKDAGAALAVFGDNNIRGADAGTQLRMTVMALASPIAKGARELAGLGIKSGQLAKDMQKGGLKLALEDLVKHFRKAGITSKEQGQVITDAFGKKAGVGLSILAGQMKRFESKFPALDKSARIFGESVAKVQRTAGQQAKELAAGFEAMSIKIGQRLLPPLMSMFNFVRTHTGLVIGLGLAVGGLSAVISGVSAAIRIYRGVTAFATAMNLLFTTSVDAETGAVTGFGLAAKIWAGITRVAAAAQWLWNAAMDANPIGLVIIAIGALVVGVIYAYKHFAWFRDLVRDVWAGIRTGAVDLWHGLNAGWHAVWDAVRAVTRVFADQVLGFFGMILHGAAWAFGWIPGIGPKLRNAAKEFDVFHRRVDAALSFKDKTVTVGIDFASAQGPGHVRVPGHAAGWRVPGYGGGDRYPALLEGGEAVVPKHLVPAVAPFLAANRVPGFAAGGVGGGLSVQAAFPSVPVLAAVSLAVIQRMAGANALSLLGGLAGGSSGTAAGAVQQWAKSHLGAYGWGPGQFPPLQSLWNRESGWRWNALNPTSGAYGIPQALPASKMASAGADWRTNPVTQMRWGLGYIGSVYGTPAAAWAHEISAGWYGDGLRNGLFTRPTLIGVGERGPELVNITPGRGGAGRRHYTIVNNIPPNANLAEIGRVTVNAIQAFEKGSGKSWRS